MSLKLYTPKEVSLILKISYRATLDMIKNSNLEAMKVPGGYRVSREDLETYINNNGVSNGDNR